MAWIKRKLSTKAGRIAVALIVLNELRGLVVVACVLAGYHHLHL